MYDLVVIGGGSGGLNVASAAASVGAKVALIEKHKLGGECTHYACVPSKALLRAAHLAHSCHVASGFGIKVGTVEVDFPSVMRRVREVVQSFYEGDSESHLREKGIDVFFGSPQFEAYDSLVIDGKTRIESRRFVIATGSRPAIPQIPGLIETGFLDNQTLWGIEELPPSLAIVGAGPVGLEFAQAFHRLGSKVTLFDRNPEILSREEPEAAASLRERLEAEGIVIHRNVEVTGIGRKPEGVIVKFRSHTDDRAFEAVRSHLLVAAGRVANIEGLNLEAAGIHHATAKGIPVDDYGATSAPTIYALGDVTGKDMYTHAAEREAAVVFQNAVLKIPKKGRRDAIPRTIFTEPEFASVGLTEAAARADHANVRTFTLDLGKVDRVRIDGDSGGLAKVVATESGKILGATIVGPGATLALQELVVAIDQGMTLGDLAEIVHPYPTLLSGIRTLTNQFNATKLESGLVRGALKWIYGFRPAATSKPE